ncbi:MAG: hypothetical protein RMJ56_09575 [Gemmataceae bacterium]|nr:hypothetical protein [Gemmataceae bacterium]
MSSLKVHPPDGRAAASRQAGGTDTASWGGASSSDSGSIGKLPPRGDAGPLADCISPEADGRGHVEASPACPGAGEFADGIVPADASEALTPEETPETEASGQAGTIAPHHGQGAV